MINIQIPDELELRIIEGIMENHPEASRGSGLVCVGWDYKNHTFTFQDEEGNFHKVHLPALKEAFKLMFTDKWPKGCTQPIARSDWESWNDWLCECDAIEFDAFAQLAVLGEVVYG